MFAAAMLCVGMLAQEPVLAPPRHGVYVVAHRGAHQGIPENTLAAYAKAMELGCDFVEIDVRTTKDGVLVSIHNDSVDAYVKDGTAGKVRDFTLAELKALDIGSRVDPRWKDERVPTVAEILELCKGKIGIYIDLKDADVDAMAKLLRKYEMEREAIWYASPRNLERLVQVCPECIPMPDPGLEKNLAATLARFQPKVVASVWRYFTPEFVKTCHAAGAIVIVDESDPSCWEDAIAWGSDGIQTDHPEELIAFLKAKAAGKP